MLQSNAVSHWLGTLESALIFSPGFPWTPSAWTSTVSLWVEVVEWVVVAETWSTQESRIGVGQMWEVVGSQRRVGAGELHWVEVAPDVDQTLQHMWQSPLHPVMAQEALTFDLDTDSDLVLENDLVLGFVLDLDTEPVLVPENDLDLDFALDLETAHILHLQHSFVLAHAFVPVLGSHIGLGFARILDSVFDLEYDDLDLDFSPSLVPGTDHDLPYHTGQGTDVEASYHQV